MPDFEEQLARAANEAPLDEALAGLRRIADAAGIFRATWSGQSVAEVCDMIAAWIRRTRDLPPQPGAPVAVFLAFVPVAAGQQVAAAGAALVRPAGPGLDVIGTAITGGGVNEQVWVRLS